MDKNRAFRMEKAIEDGSLKEFGTYLMGSWEEIVRRRAEDIPGSCTEAQISHLLSERFSREPPGWSDKGLGVLTKQRIYIKNGGKIEAEHFKTKQESTYAKYAEKMLEEAVSGASDRKIFLHPQHSFKLGHWRCLRLHRQGRCRSKSLPLRQVLPRTWH